MENNSEKQLGRHSQGLIPDPNELAEFLEIDSCIPHHELIVSQMLDPLKDMFSVSGKKIRFEMIEIAFKALRGVLDEKKRRQLRVCEHIIEGLHLGSMIIDDIQDQSEIRRGRPTLHLKYGIGVALNAGNWLYFQAIQQIQYLELEPSQEIALQRRLNEILLKAHFGQGIDVGVDMNTLPQDQVESAYFTAAELKTGALMALAFDLGAAVASPQGEHQRALSKLAKRLGIALQILDDIGNYLAPPPKGKEDLKMGRPSFIWVMAARLAPSSDYERFRRATRMLPDASWIDLWNTLFDLIPHSKSFASDYLTHLKSDFLKSIFASTQVGLNSLNDQSLSELIDQVERLFDKLEKAYG
jgi:geranylgeranyl pyrophosphate synthase